MTFSIIIPAYNAAEFLPQCLDSIFNQNYTDYEVLCIDDGSTDDTPELLRQYASKHPQLRILTQSNQGMATARNRGLDEARGEYILFVDSDDLLTDGALATLVAEFSGEDIIAFNARKLHDATGEQTYHPTIREPETTDGWSYFCRHRLEATDIHFVCIWQRAYRRRFLVDNNLRFADGLRRAEDDLFTTQAMLYAKSVKTIANCLYTYRVRQGSITRTADPALEADSRRAHHMLEELFLPMNDIDKRALYQVLASNYITRLAKGDTLSPDEWHRFRLECVTSRHRRLYRLTRLHPTLLRIYLNRNTI